MLVFPVLLYLLWLRSEQWFAILFCINLITDVLDGFIARTWNIETQMGARLDSLADMGTFIAAFLGLYRFKLEEIGTAIHLLLPFLILFLIANIISLIRFGKWPSLHLYTTKVAGYIQGFFFFLLFSWQYIPVLFYLAIGAGYLSWTEEILVLILLPGYRSNARGLYFLFRERNK